MVFVCDGDELGSCPICGRPMIKGPSTDRHHFTPRSQGGRASRFVHRICHRKLHSLWSERELARRFEDPAAIRAAPEMQDFLRWIARKPPQFWAPTRASHRRRKR